MIYLLAATLILVAALAGIAFTSRRHKRFPNLDDIISCTGTVDTSLTPEGSVIIHGELWLARSANGNHIQARAPIKVVGAVDHFLLVTPT